MPTLLELYGVKVIMRPKDKEHEPPHLHIITAGFDASIDIETQEITGDFPENKKALVKSWVKANKDILKEIWDTQEFIKMGQ